MPHRLLRFGLAAKLGRRHPEPRMFREPERLKDGYDVVIIGGGGHGLAAAYYLARDHGIRNIAVLEKGYLGGGNTGRNTTIIRSNYLTPEGVKFYDASVQLWQDLSAEFDLNLFYSTRGHFTLAHTDADLRTMRWRAEVNKHFGVRWKSSMPAFVEAPACRRSISTAAGTRPILGALYHAPGAIARHDAVAWGYGRGADRRGVEIHQNTEVLGIDVRDGAVTGVRTIARRHRRRAGCCAPSPGTRRACSTWSGCASPIYIHPLQAMVSEPMKPWLDPIIVSGSLHVYVSQTARGELVMGASLDPLRTALHALDARFRRRPRGAHARPVPVPVRGEGQPAVGGHGGHDAGLRADHGHDADRRLLSRRRLGHVGFQGHAGLRQDDEPHRGDGHQPSA